MSNSDFYQRTSFNSVVIWQPVLNPEFILPITLSVGTGVENFINIETPSNNIISKQYINGTVGQWGKPIRVTGTATFNIQSTALIALQKVLSFQANTRIPVYGTLIITSVGTKTLTTFIKCVWTSPFVGANYNKTTSDVIQAFEANIPTFISFTSAAALASSLSGLVNVTSLL